MKLILVIYSFLFVSCLAVTRVKTSQSDDIGTTQTPQEQLNVLQEEVHGLKRDLVKATRVIQKLEYGLNRRPKNIRIKRQATTFLVPKQEPDRMNTALGPPGPPGKQGPPGPPENATSGATYIRWGRTTCGNDSALIYNGKVGGQHYYSKGGGANYICLHNTPEWGNYSGKQHVGGFISFAEYRNMDSSNILGVSGKTQLQDNDIPCAACLSEKRSAMIMIPGRLSCEQGWTKEYDGYLVTGRRDQNANYAYECLDAAPEVAEPNAGARTNRALMYLVQNSCRSDVTCPRYIKWREITCVVCTK